MNYGVILAAYEAVFIYKISAAFVTLAAETRMVRTNMHIEKKTHFKNYL